jgi:hypothetical protein
MDVAGSYSGPTYGEEDPWPDRKKARTFTQDTLRPAYELDVVFRSLIR